MCQMGPNGAKSYHLPNLHHFHSEGTFLQVMNNGKVKLFSPHLAPLKGPNEAKSEFLPNLHHIQGTGTLLQVVNKDKVTIL